MTLTTTFSFLRISAFMIQHRERHRQTDFLAFIARLFLGLSRQCLARYQKPER